MVDLDRSISVARKSGKTSLGIKSALQAVKSGDAKVIVVAVNAPKTHREDLEYYARLSDVPILIYPKSSQDLGIVCGRPHLTAFLTVINPGDSDIMKIVK